MSYLPSDPDLSNIGGLLAKYPRRGILLFKLLEDNSQSDGSPLNKELQELIVEYVSTLNEPASGILRSEEFAPDVEPDGQGCPQSNAIKKKAKTLGKLTPVMGFLRKLTLTPEQINGADVAPIFAAGWSERDFLDLVCLCSVVNCINRLAVGVGLNRKSDFSQRIFSKSPPRQPQEPVIKKLIFNH